MIHQIPVDGYHLYAEECGNREGKPVVFLHGGPGSGCSPEHRRFFDPDFYRIILFDQRGSGRSQPAGETMRNTTQDLVSDLELIRNQLDIDNWLLFGGSWGGTLGLAYAIAHPSRVSGMILRGVFLAREIDLDWFFFRLKGIFPTVWRYLTEDIPDCASADDLISWYYKVVHGSNQNLAIEAARRWSDWGGHVVHWHTAKGSQSTPKNPEQRPDYNERLLAKVKIETHFAQHRYFMNDNELLQRIEHLTDRPVTIVHGMFDLTCSMESAWLLHQAITGSKLLQLEQTGHLIDEPEMISTLVEECNRFRALI